MQSRRSHLYHIINPSPWPFFVSMSLFNVLAGVILWVNKYVIGGNIFVISFLILVCFVQFWFADIVREGSYEGKHTSYVQKGLKLGMILFIVSEVMFFFGFFWGYFHFSLSPAIEIGCLWPPYGIQVFNYLHVPLLNTFILLVSGAWVTWCHHELVSGFRWKLVLKRNKKYDVQDWIYRDQYVRAMKPEKIDLFRAACRDVRSYFFGVLCATKYIDTIIGLIVTILLAITFTFYQVLEYTEASFNISDSVYGSIFFMATGFHGFHVLLGTCFLLYCLVRLLNGHFGKEHHLGLEFAIWYWHFVDVVWLFLYVCVYWWASTSLI